METDSKNEHKTFKRLKEILQRLRERWIQPYQMIVVKEYPDGRPIFRWLLPPTITIHRRWYPPPTAGPLEPVDWENFPWLGPKEKSIHEVTD
jgi:hypothetical protein